jgi:hypothetical protein
VGNKKQRDERLQEVRNPKSDKVKYLKRKQLEEEADKQLKEYARRKEQES